MSRPPRVHLPKTTYEWDRNTEEGMGYLANQTDALLFAHALNCVEHDQVPSILVVNDDGYRGIAHDLTGDRSNMWRDTNSDTARTGRAEYEISKKKNFWERGRVGETIILDEQTVIKRIVDLEERFGGDRGKLLLFIEHWGKEMTLSRPPQMSERYPESVTFVPKPPPELLHYGIEGARSLVEAAIALRKLEREAMGDYELEPEGPRPLFDGADEDAVEQAYADYAEFCERHYRAYQQFKRGRRNVVFPAGTVFWRLRANVKVEKVSATR